MIRYGKMAQAAIRLMSVLAEHFTEGARMNSRDLGAARGIPAPLTAKLLTQLSAHGLVTGAPGPGGGYQLAKTPDAIRLADIVRIFEPHQRSIDCPFGDHWCGHGPKCPLHDQIVALEAEAHAFLSGTSLAVFATSPRPKGASALGGAVENKLRSR